MSRTSPAYIHREAPTSIHSCVYASSDVLCYMGSCNNENSWISSVHWLPSKRTRRLWEINLYYLQSPGTLSKDHSQFTRLTSNVYKALRDSLLALRALPC